MVIKRNMTPRILPSEFIDEQLLKVASGGKQNQMKCMF